VVVEQDAGLQADALLRFPPLQAPVLAPQDRVRRDTPAPTVHISKRDNLWSNVLIAWPGNASNNVILVTRDRVVSGIPRQSRVFVSADLGATWRLQPAVPESARIRNVVPSPADAGLLVLVGSDSAFYLTRDGGQSFTVRPGTDGNRFLLHPTNPALMAYSAVGGQVKLSADFGLTASDLLNTGGGEAFATFFWLPVVANGTSSHLLIISVEVTVGTSVRFSILAVNPATGTRRTLAAPAGHALVRGGIWSEDSAIFCLASRLPAPGSSTTAAQAAVAVSHNGGDFAAVTFAGLPVPSEFRLLEAHFGIFFLTARDRQSNFTAFGLQAGTTAAFRLLEDLVCVSGVCDFLCSPRIAGICLANRRRDDVGYGHTQLTTDFGESWGDVPAPVNSSCAPSDPTCTLHLHLAATQTDLNLNFPPTVRGAVLPFACLCAPKCKSTLLSAVAVA
jgi:hypothetical protein